MSEYLRRSTSLSVADRFYFPPNLKHIPVNDQIVVLSPETANWLVLEKEEVIILERLISGDNIGTILSWTKENNCSKQLQRLLSQISSRQFANIIDRPFPKVDQSVKGAYFYLTNACNLRCSHCYMLSGAADKNELSIEEWISVIDDFVECGGTNITFSGGEVLAKKGWLHILEHANSKGISSTILTNGTLWTQATIEAIAIHISEVQVSVDGPSETVNAITRGEHAFTKAIETAQFFARLGVRTSIAMTPTLDTIDFFEKEFLDFFNANIRGTGINVRIGHKLLDGREVRMLTNEVKAAYEAATRRLSDLIYPLSDLRTFALGHQPNELRPNCGFGGLTISATGDAYPCNRISDVHSFGNVRSRKLAEILLDLKISEDATNVDSITPCKWCDLRYICGGGCRIDDYHVSNRHEKRGSFKAMAIDRESVIHKVECTEEHRKFLLKTMARVTDYLFVVDD